MLGGLVWLLVEESLGGTQVTTDRHATGRK
jgi:hypothetical protein